MALELGNHQYERKSPQPSQPWLVSLCPTMDLVALVPKPANQLEVVRFNGERAFNIRKYPSQATITLMCWKNDGMTIDLAWSDGVIDVVSTQLGKVWYSYNPSDDLQPSNDEKRSPRQISSLSRGMHVVVGSKLSNTTADTRNHRSYVLKRSSNVAKSKQWSARNGKLISSQLNMSSLRNSDELDAIKDLPRQLAIIDITEDFPNLMPLPDVEESTFHSRPDMFISQHGVDMYLGQDRTKSATDIVDISLSAWDDGSVIARLNNHFQFGRYAVTKDNSDDEQSIEPHSIIRAKHIESDKFGSNRYELQRASSGHGTDTTVTDSASHPLSSLHSILIQRDQSKEETRQGSSSLALCLLRLNIVHRSGYFLEFASNKIVMLAHLMQYLSQAVTALHNIWTTSCDLPSRFIGNINETLAEKNKVSIDVALFHLAVTGDCLPEVKEWLVDELHERGHKRWDQALTQGYSKVIEIVHEAILPVLDKIGATLSRLRSLSTTPDVLELALDEAILSQALEHIEILRLLSHKALLHARVELRQFRTFIDWLLNQIRLQSASPNSTAADEAAEKVAAVDFSELQLYILAAMTRSKLSAFLPAAGKDQVKEYSSTSKVIVNEALHKHDDLANQKQAGSVMNIDLSFVHRARHLHVLLQSLTRRIVEGIQNSQLVSKPITLETTQQQRHTAMRMVFETHENNDFMTTYILSIPVSSGNKIRIHRVVHLQERHSIAHNLEDSVTPVSPQIFTIALNKDARIRDIAFVDDDLFAVLVQNQDSSSVIQLPYSMRICTSSKEALHDRYIPMLEAVPDWRRIASDEEKELSKIQSDPCFVLQTLMHQSEQSQSQSQSRFVPGSMELVVREEKMAVVLLLLGDDGMSYRIYQLKHQPG